MGCLEIADVFLQTFGVFFDQPLDFVVIIFFYLAEQGCVRLVIIVVFVLFRVHVFHGVGFLLSRLKRQEHTQFARYKVCLRICV